MTYDAFSDKCITVPAAKLFADAYIIVASPFTMRLNNT